MLVDARRQPACRAAAVANALSKLRQADVTRTVKGALAPEKQTVNPRLCGRAVALAADTDAERKSPAP
jgi:hypothetical protein